MWLFYCCVSISVHLVCQTRRLPWKNDNLFSSHSSQLISAVQICPVWTCNLWKFPTSWLICKHAHISLRVREVTFSRRPLGLLICWEFYFSSFTLTHFYCYRKQDMSKWMDFLFTGTIYTPFITYSCKQNESRLLSRIRFVLTDGYC